MTISHQITLNMADVIEMLDNKIGTGRNIDPRDVIITDYSASKPPEVPEDIEGVGDRKDSDSITLFKKSNILAVLKEGLKAANAENKYPKDAKTICLNAMDEILVAMSKKESVLFSSMICTGGFDKFALLWQKYQSCIQKKL